ncbi:sulfotransferase domain-containing protein [Aegicerativicinus sediminis]|uniref:sulfotransferase domain-containing protein n=1 Tax=Aegicerativicinus sediminis TaxID=2893202 RepID=UPI001E4E9B99|nr:sulfotransferase domain-containing protein [Aegicerativicinus sediminis]
MNVLEKLSESVEFYKKIKFTKIENQENILIYGISRGGTTMLANALTKTLDARLIWEPLFKYNKVFLKRVNPYSTYPYTEFKLGWHPNLPTQGTVEINNYFDDLFSMRERNIRFLRFNNWDRFKTSKKTIFKFCFGNFMYPYFQNRYNYKSIVLLRHPFAIASSSLGYGDNFDWHKTNFNIWKYMDNELNPGFFKNINNKIETINSPFELIVFQVVSQFSYVLDQLDTSNSIFIFYEDLLLNPKGEVNKIEALLGYEIDREQFLNIIKKPSFSSKKGHTNTNAMEQLTKWQKKCTEEDVQGGLKIFKSFNFNHYDDNPLPKSIK